MVHRARATSVPRVGCCSVPSSLDCLTFAAIADLSEVTPLTTRLSVCSGSIVLTLAFLEGIYSNWRWWTNVTVICGWFSKLNQFLYGLIILSSPPVTQSLISNAALQHARWHFRTLPVKWDARRAIHMQHYRTSRTNIWRWTAGIDYFSLEHTPSCRAGASGRLSCKQWGEMCAL